MAMASRGVFTVPDGGLEGEASAFLEANRSYVDGVLHPVLDSLVHEVLLERPQDPRTFMIKALCRHMNISDPFTLQDEIDQLKSQLNDTRALQRVLSKVEGRHASETTSDYLSEPSSDVDDSDDEDEIGDLPSPHVQIHRLARPRHSVSAEAYGEYNKRRAFVPPVHQKTEDQKRRIHTVLGESFLFSSLEKEELTTVIDAMEELVLPTKTRIIQQGDDGDCLYLVEKGAVNCLKETPTGGETVVKVCEPGDVFGELALLYYCPRAASVESTGEAVLWKLDRETFNHIVRDAAAKKRETFESFLSSVPILQHLDPYERAKIADALKTLWFEAEADIVTQGDSGDTFYLVVKGEACALKSFDGGPIKQVMQYGVGDYFGELAILRNEPRAATVRSNTSVEVAYLDRRSFKRLLGPVEEILLRNIQKYKLRKLASAGHTMTTSSSAEGLAPQSR